MPFQMPITIAEVLAGIQKQEFVLPAIQREFVWDPGQIARLFDSLLRGYPIGSFLFWRVDGDHVGEFRFYGVMQKYHGLEHPHCPVLELEKGTPVTAILDGQQRLSALNIALRGSYASRLPGKWWNNPKSYPKRRLYLNVCGAAPDNELGMHYDLQFLAHSPPSQPDTNAHWFPVHEVLSFKAAPDLFHYLHQNGVAGHPTAFDTLHRLHEAVTKDRVVNYYEEHDQDVDKVLDIFIRTNSGGTVLSYSDLLLSIATAQWKDLDAREEIHGLVDELNDMGQGFSFSKDLVLKTGLS